MHHLVRPGETDHCKATGSWSGGCPASLLDRCPEQPLGQPTELVPRPGPLVEGPTAPIPDVHDGGAANG